MKNFFLYLFLLLSAGLYAQDSLSLQGLSRQNDVSNKNYKERKWLIGGLSASGYAGSFIFLNQSWYKGFPRSSFHTFNDIGEWNQMDKAGHAWTAYNASRLTAWLWQWAGLSHNSSVVVASSGALLYMLSIEYLDGLSAEWGWSWPDAGADLFGTILYASQELGWRQQRIQLKFSSHYTKYSPASLQERANAIFGNSLPERILKDYNAQTYWLSLNLSSLLPSKKIPPWLNIALGYGADGMFGGYVNMATDKNGSVIFDRRDIRRYRQWYLSPDIDFTKIRTKSKILHSVFSVINILKVPAPSIEFSNGRVCGHWLQF